MRLIRTLCLSVAALLLLSAPSSAQVVGVSISVAPPPIPVYVQPPIPGPGYIWVPGYWAWDEDDYYWVPGTWVLPPTIGYLWTPGYWHWRDSGYYWHAGYWGPRVGFYGGVNYGCGYFGSGYVGGRWRGRVFAYNTAVTNIGTTRITNVYIDKTVIVNKTTSTNVSFHGGRGGTTVRPTAEEHAAESDKRVAPTFSQTKHQRAARTDRALFAKTNEGKPAIAATERAGQLPGKASLGSRESRDLSRSETLQAPSTSPRSARGSGEPTTTSGPKSTTVSGPRDAALGSGRRREITEERQPGSGEPTTTSGPKSTAVGGPRDAALGSGRRREIREERQPRRIDQARAAGPGFGGAPRNGGAKEHARSTTARGGPQLPQSQGGRPSPEAKRSPYQQGKRPDQG
jgi:YXWGXW repeat-containing protein